MSIKGKPTGEGEIGISIEVSAPKVGLNSRAIIVIICIVVPILYNW